MAFIPALKYHFLSPFYDWFISLSMPEKEVKQKVLELAELKGDELILDFGCGTATLAAICLAEFQNIKVIGLDVDQTIIDIASKKAIKELELVRYDGNVIPFPDHYFDKILSTWVFHHLDRSEKIDSFKELKRVLKPNGVFVLADWGRPSNTLQRTLFLILQVFDNFYTTKDNVKGEIPVLLEQSGFKNVKEKGFRNTLFGTLCYWTAK